MGRWATNVRAALAGLSLGHRPLGHRPRSRPAAPPCVLALALACLGVTCPPAASAAPASAPPGSPAPCHPPFDPPVDLRGRVSALCGIHAPEDVEVSPDGRHLIVSETRGLDDLPGRLAVVDVATGLAAELPRLRDGQSSWGDPACRDPGAEAPFSPHGISLGRRADGALELLVVDHAGREAIDVFEVRRRGDGFAAVWRGCVQNDGPGLFNDVSVAPGGGFAATIMFEKPAMIERPGQPKGSAMTAILSGRDTGYLVAWAPGSPIHRLPASDAGFNNGIQVRKDGRLIYFAAWTAKQLKVYDVVAHRIVSSTPLDFLPDNLSLGRDGTILVTGITDVELWRTCYEQHVAFCPSGFRVAAWAPDTGRVTPLFSGPPGLIAGASVAVEAGGALYVGSYAGDRLLRITPKP